MAKKKMKPAKARKPKATAKKSSPSSKIKKSSESSKIKIKKSQSKSKEFLKDGLSPEKGTFSKIVALDAKTGKEAKRPKAGKQVFYGIKGVKGKIKKIKSGYPQKYSKVDQKGLQDILNKSGEKNFVVYEELTNEAVKKGNKVEYRSSGGKFLRDKKGKKIPVYKTKITGAHTKRPQRAVLMERGKRIRELSLGFRKMSKRERVDAELLTMIEPQRDPDEGKFKKEIFLQGNTIRDTIKNVNVPISIADMRRQKLSGLRVEGRIYFKGMDIDNMEFMTKIPRLADFPVEVAKAIRFKLGDHGYRFTSLVELYKLAKEFPKYRRAILNVGVHPPKPVKLLTPVFPETAGRPRWPLSERQDLVSVRLNITGY